MTRTVIIAEEVTIKSYNPILQFEDVKGIWNDMLTKCPHSFFLSWGWQEVWLKSLPKDSNLSLMVGFKNNKPIFAFFLGSQKVIRLGLFPVRQISLNTTSIKNIDQLTIEYNAILMDPEITLSLGTLIQQLPIKNWDEFYFSRISLSLFPNFDFNINSHHNYNITREVSASHYVDLQKVRDAGMDYLSLLSTNKRYQIRRSIKAYEKKGSNKVQVHAANTIDEALLMLEGLKKLHQETWVKRGEPGAFASGYFYKFHKDLIANRFKNNEIQLLHVTCGQDTIGYNYNFIFNGNALNYQSGFNYLPQKVYLPGLTCHCLSVLYNAAKGLNTYDFLVGNVQYKRSLSTDFFELENILAQKKKVKFAIENILRLVYRSAQNGRVNF